MTRILLALLAFLLSAPAHAQEDAATFFKGKTLRIVVGSGVGSGYDITARTLARHMGAHIPGNPTVIVQNQPGAGGAIMTNSLYATGPFDGTVIGAPFNGTPTMPLLSPQSARFDAEKLIYIGSTNRETQVMYVWSTVPVQTLDDVKTTELVMGAQAPGSTQYDYPVLLNRLLGYKFKVVTGYESTPKIHLALERGEVQGTIANWSTLKALNSNWLADNKIRLLAQWGLKRLPEHRQRSLDLRFHQDRCGSCRHQARGGAARIRPAVLSAAGRAAGPRRGACGAPSTPRSRIRPFSARRHGAHRHRSAQRRRGADLGRRGVKDAARCRCPGPRRA